MTSLLIRELPPSLVHLVEYGVLERVCTEPVPV